MNITLVKDDELSSAINKELEGVAKMSDIEAMFDAKLEEKGKSLPAVVDPEDKADMEEGMVAGITKTKFWGVPIGEATVGGFTAVFASEVIDGFMAAQGNVVKGFVKLVTAGAAVKFGKKVFGDTGCKAVALLLAYDGMRMILPLDEWAHKFASALSGVIPSGGLGGRAGMNNVSDKPPAPGGSGSYYGGINARVG